MLEAATGSSEIAGHIATVADAVQGTTAGTDEIRGAAHELSRMASDLQRLVLRFKIRSGGPPTQPAA